MTVLAVVLSLALGAAVASACESPQLTLGKASAGPGDPVPFTIAPSEAGATYELTIDGQPIEGGSGTDTTSADGVSGTLIMPATASSGATIEMLLTHEGASHSHNGSNTGPWTDSKTIAPPAAPPADPPATQAEVPAQAAPAPIEAQPSPAESSPNGHPGAFDGTGPNSGGPAASAFDQSATDAVGQGTSEGSSSDRSGSPAEATQATGAEPGTPGGTSAGEAAGSLLKQRTNAGGQGEGRDHASQFDSTSLEGTVAPLPALPQFDQIPREVGTPVNIASGALLGGLMTLLLVVASMLALAARRGGGTDEAGAKVLAPHWTPPSLEAEAKWRSALMEAELQEMISEARAAQILRSPVHEELAVADRVERTEALIPL